jgi:FtsP/CotA-like multicopper oxidase with cupredoxin domain
MMQRGREAVVRFINHGDRANSVHLHGSYSRAPFDGWAEDTTLVGQYKDYCKSAKCHCQIPWLGLRLLTFADPLLDYPNSQNGRTLWYHDHAVTLTAENSYFGQAGFYLIRDPEEQNMPGLPQGT